MSDALTCKKCRADLGDPFLTARWHAEADCAALQAANARIAELRESARVRGEALERAERERDDLRAQLAAARADADRLRQQAVGG